MKIQNPKSKIQTNLNFQFSKISKKIGYWSSMIGYSPRRRVGGFTLVELLVVIGIASLSLALLFPNFMGARLRARDAQRKRELTDIQKALELYKLDDPVGAYPTTGALAENLCNTCWTAAADCEGNVYMHRFPCDPRAPTPYMYIVPTGESGEADTRTYRITACLENVVDPDRDLAIEPTCAAKSLSSFTVKEP